MVGTQVDICPKLWASVEEEIEKISDGKNELALEIKMKIFRQLLNPDAEEILKACKKVERGKREKIAEILLAMAGFDKTKLSTREPIPVRKAELLMRLEDEKSFYFLIYSDWDSETIAHILRAHMTYSDLIAVSNYCRATGLKNSEVIRSFALNKRFIRLEQERICKIQAGRDEILRSLEGLALTFPEALHEDFQSVCLRKISRPEIARIRHVVNSYAKGEINISDVRKILDKSCSRMIPSLKGLLKA